MSVVDGDGGLLDAEHAEPGDGGAVAVDALRRPGTLVVAVRTDGRAAVRTGLPDGVDPAALRAPVLVGDTVAVVLDIDVDTEPIAMFGRFADARSLLVGLPDAQRVLGALGFAQWRARTRFCPRDGSALEPRPDGRVLRCARGHEEFPRLEPAVIMRVVDEEDRILLGRQPRWPEGRFSVLAGFVDPGEALEDAVVREVAEEVGIPVTGVRYEGSQPWPFPASLMLGFSAVATDTRVRLEDEEIGEARWYGRESLMAAMAGGELFLPSDLSIAHRLITDWLGHVEIASWDDQR